MNSRLMLRAGVVGLMMFAWTGAGGAASLYHPDVYQPLAADTSSFRVGDEVTVVIAEASQAQSQADSSTTRETNVSATPQDSLHQYTVGADLKHNFNGSGATDRNGTLSAQISARVQDVAANGDLAIYGTQKITINGEIQTISVSGVVRPIDVQSGNIVMSTRLSNANIVYSGKGFVDRNQNESWISRLLGLFGL